jgi:hypothetical protein
MSSKPISKPTSTSNPTARRRALLAPALLAASLLAPTLFLGATPARADDFGASVQHTFQTDIPHFFTNDVPHFFQDDIPCAFGGKPTSGTRSSCNSGRPAGRAATSAPRDLTAAPPDEKPGPPEAPPPSIPLPANR